MTPTTAFFQDPARLPGTAGAYLRGEGPFPEHAVWLGHPSAGWGSRLRLWIPLALAVVLVVESTRLWSPCNGVAFVMAVSLGIASREWSRSGPSRPPGAGRHGLFLLEDHIVYRLGADCAVVARADIIGVERRKGTDHRIQGAFLLRGRTGRGALPAPTVGEDTVAIMQEWLGGTGFRESSPPEA